MSSEQLKMVPMLTATNGAEWTDMMTAYLQACGHYAAIMQYKEAYSGQTRTPAVAATATTAAVAAGPWTGTVDQALFKEWNKANEQSIGAIKL